MRANIKSYVNIYGRVYKNVLSTYLQSLLYVQLVHPRSPGVTAADYVSISSSLLYSWHVPVKNSSFNTANEIVWSDSGHVI